MEECVLQLTDLLLQRHGLTVLCGPPESGKQLCLRQSIDALRSTLRQRSGFACPAGLLRSHGSAADAEPDPVVDMPVYIDPGQITAAPRAELLRACRAALPALCSEARMHAAAAAVGPAAVGAVTALLAASHCAAAAGRLHAVALVALAAALATEGPAARRGRVHAGQLATAVCAVAAATLHCMPKRDELPRDALVELPDRHIAYVSKPPSVAGDGVYEVVLVTGSETRLVPASDVLSAIASKRSVYRNKDRLEQRAAEKRARSGRSAPEQRQGPAPAPKPFVPEPAPKPLVLDDDDVELAPVPQRLLLDDGPKPLPALGPWVVVDDDDDDDAVGPQPAPKLPLVLHDDDDDDDDDGPQPAPKRPLVVYDDDDDDAGAAAAAPAPKRPAVAVGGDKGLVVPQPKRRKLHIMAWDGPVWVERRAGSGSWRLVPFEPGADGQDGVDVSASDVRADHVVLPPETFLRCSAQTGDEFRARAGGRYSSSAVVWQHTVGESETGVAVTHRLERGFALPSERPADAELRTVTELLLAPRGCGDSSLPVTPILVVRRLDVVVERLRAGGGAREFVLWLLRLSEHMRVVLTTGRPWHAEDFEASLPFWARVLHFDRRTAAAALRWSAENAVRLGAGSDTPAAELAAVQRLATQVVHLAPAHLQPPIRLPLVLSAVRRAEAALGTDVERAEVGLSSVRSDVRRGLLHWEQPTFAGLVQMAYFLCSRRSEKLQRLLAKMRERKVKGTAATRAHVQKLRDMETADHWVSPDRANQMVQQLAAAVDDVPGNPSAVDCPPAFTRLMLLRSARGWAAFAAEARAWLRLSSEEQGRRVRSAATVLRQRGLLEQHVRSGQVQVGALGAPLYRPADMTAADARALAALLRVPAAGQAEFDGAFDGVS